MSEGGDVQSGGYLDRMLHGFGESPSKGGTKAKAPKENKSMKRIRIENRKRRRKQQIKLKKMKEKEESRIANTLFDRKKRTKKLDPMKRNMGVRGGILKKRRNKLVTRIVSNAGGRNQFEPLVSSPKTILEKQRIEVRDVEEYNHQGNVIAPSVISEPIRRNKRFGYGRKPISARRRNLHSARARRRNPNDLNSSPTSSIRTLQSIRTAPTEVGGGGSRRGNRSRRRDRPWRNTGVQKKEKKYNLLPRWKQMMKTGYSREIRTIEEEIKGMDQLLADKNKNIRIIQGHEKLLGKELERLERRRRGRKRMKTKVQDFHQHEENLGYQNTEFESEENEEEEKRRSRKNRRKRRKREEVESDEEYEGRRKRKRRTKRREEVVEVEEEENNNRTKSKPRKRRRRRRRRRKRRGKEKDEEERRSPYNRSGEASPPKYYIPSEEEEEEEEMRNEYPHETYNRKEYGPFHSDDDDHHPGEEEEYEEFYELEKEKEESWRIAEQKRREEEAKEKKRRKEEEFMKRRKPKVFNNHHHPSYNDDDDGNEQQQQQQQQRHVRRTKRKKKQKLSTRMIEVHREVPEQPHQQRGRKRRTRRKKKKKAVVRDRHQPQQEKGVFVATIRGLENRKITQNHQEQNNNNDDEEIQPLTSNVFRRRRTNQNTGRGGWRRRNVNSSFDDDDDDHEEEEEEVEELEEEEHQQQIKGSTFQGIDLMESMDVPKSIRSGLKPFSSTSSPSIRNNTTPSRIIGKKIPIEEGRIVINRE